MNPKVETYILRQIKCKDELNRLRSIAMICDLLMEYKWASPCYSYQKNIIIGMREFKDYCDVGF